MSVTAVLMSCAAMASVVGSVINLVIQRRRVEKEAQEIRLSAMQEVVIPLTEEQKLHRIRREQHAPRDAWVRRTPQDATPEQWAARHPQDRRA